MLSCDSQIDKHGRTTYPFKCACGNVVYLCLSAVMTGHDTSCGCGLGKQFSIAKRQSHGLSHHPLYKTWNNITQRCGKHKNYLNIAVCEEWRSNFKSFYDWSVNNGWKEGLTIDRIDYNGDYEPANCRWITQSEQTRNTSRNHTVTINGITKCVTDWCDLYGISLGTFYDRIKAGMSEHEALFTPSRQGYKSMRKSLITYNGETKTVNEWAKTIGIHPQTIVSRILNWKDATPDELLSPRFKKYHKANV